MALELVGDCRVEPGVTLSRVVVWPGTHVTEPATVAVYARLETERRAVELAGLF